MGVKFGADVLRFAMKLSAVKVSCLSTGFCNMGGVTGLLIKILSMRGNLGCCVFGLATNAMR
jgi:hypothetical protein